MRRELPRIPFYDDFDQWAKWGKQLMSLHINYETVPPFQSLQVITVKDIPLPKARLKANKVEDIICLDENTELRDIPSEAWNYRLGTCSALEWILDQYKENKPKDSIITKESSTYHFADYKEQVIDLLKRVCTVSVETMRIVEEMP